MNPPLIELQFRQPIMFRLIQTKPPPFPLKCTNHVVQPTGLRSRIVVVLGNGRSPTAEGLMGDNGWRWCDGMEGWRDFADWCSQIGEKNGSPIGESNCQPGLFILKFYNGYVIKVCFLFILFSGFSNSILISFFFFNQCWKMKEAIMLVFWFWTLLISSFITFFDVKLSKGIRLNNWKLNKIESEE